MSGIRTSLVVVAALIVGSACNAAAAERQQAGHVRHHAGFASLDYGRTPRVFDGTWNLTASTAAGSCGSYGFRVNVVNGRVVSPGISGVSGRVTPARNVSETARRGNWGAAWARRPSGRAGGGRR